MAPKASAVAKDLVLEAKLAKQFNDIVQKHRKLPEPIRVPCDQILVHPRNRQGQPPNTQYIHKSLCPNLMSQGFDPNRPSVGYLVELSNDAIKKQVVDFNKSLAKQTGVMPPIFDDTARYACLGGNHLTISMRLMKHNTVSPITGQMLTVPAGDEELKKVVEVGHRYVVLKPDELTDAEAELISRWLNTDQDQNQSSGRAMVIRSLIDICAKEMTKSSIVRVSNIIAKYNQQSCVKIPANVLGCFSKWILELGAGSYCEEFLKFHAMHVNPITLTVAPNFFEDVTKARSCCDVIVGSDNLWQRQYLCFQCNYAAASLERCMCRDHMTILFCALCVLNRV